MDTIYDIWAPLALPAGSRFSTRNLAKTGRV